jgi:putative ABC transport system substrate-binding protein
LREGGFAEGQNIIIERRFAEGRLDQYAELVAELLRLKVDVIVTSANGATLAAKRATTTIPVVMLNVADPVAQGVVASLAHPGGNITGVIQDDSADVSARRLQLLKDAVPRISRVVVLTNLDEAYSRFEWKALEAAAQSLSITLQAITVSQVGDLEEAFNRVSREHPDALFVGASSINFPNGRFIMELAERSRLPVISPFREITEAGGLLSYGSVRVERFRRAGVYVSKILKGAKPADLPVEQISKYELVINIKTARSLNLEIPRALLLIADEVIE